MADLAQVSPAPRNRRAGRARDWALLLVCNLIWASQFAMVKLVQEQIGPVFAVFFPMAISTLLLVPLVSRRWPVSHIPSFILLGIAGQVVAQLFITWGVRLSLASNAALLSLALPVTTAVMARLILGERMTVMRWVSFGLALSGVLACSGVDWHEVNLRNSRYLAGNLMIFASVAGSAFYNTYSKKLLEIYSDMEVLLYSYYAVLAVMLPITLWAEPGAFRAIPLFTVRTWVGLAILAAFQYFFSMVLFLNVLSRLDATQAALSNYLIPFFGVVLSAAILGETLEWYMVAGGVLVLASTVVATVFDRPPEPTAAHK